jgi:hypothetical protein
MMLVLLWTQMAGAEGCAGGASRAQSEQFIDAMFTVMMKVCGCDCMD